METNQETTDTSSSLFPNHQIGAFKRWEEKESRSDKDQVICSLLHDVNLLKKKLETIEQDKIMEKLDLPPELSKSIGLTSKPERRIKRGMGSRFLLESEINEAYEKSYTAAGAARYLGVDIRTLKIHAKRLGIWRTFQNIKGVKKPRNPEAGKYPLTEILAGKHPDVPTKMLRAKLFRSGLKDRVCENCGFCEERITDNQMPLVIDFIDGDSKNHNLNNIRILCYNCIFMVGRGYLNAKISY